MIYAALILLYIIKNRSRVRVNSNCLVPAKPVQDSWVIEISMKKYPSAPIISMTSSNILCRAWIHFLNFPLCPCVAKLQFHFIPESWQSPLHFSVHSAWFFLCFFFFFMKVVQCCGAAVPPSTVVHSRWIPSRLVSTSRIWSLYLAPSQSLSSHWLWEDINSLPAATYSTVSSSWKTILVSFWKVICLFMCLRQITFEKYWLLSEQINR